MAQPGGVRVSSRVGWLVVVAGGFPLLWACALTRPAGAESQAVATLDNPTVGYTLRYPADWRVAGPVLATAFARDATCRSVQIVDFQPPADAGTAGFVHHAFVQLCAKPATEGESLAGFLQAVYGAPLEARFEPVEVGGLAARRLREPREPALIFVRTERHTIEIVAAVATDETHAALRRAQVDDIVASLVFRRGNDAPGDHHHGSTHHERGEQ